MQVDIKRKIYVTDIIVHYLTTDGVVKSVDGAIPTAFINTRYENTFCNRLCKRIPDCTKYLYTEFMSESYEKQLIISLDELLMNI